MKKGEGLGLHRIGSRKKHPVEHKKSRIQLRPKRSSEWRQYSKEAVKD